MNISNETFLNEQQAAELLSISVKTLQRWRWKKVGPEWCKLGKRVAYPKDKLINWAMSKSQKTSSNKEEKNGSAR